MTALNKDQHGVLLFFVFFLEGGEIQFMGKLSHLELGGRGIWRTGVSTVVVKLSYFSSFGNLCSKIITHDYKVNQEEGVRRSYLWPTTPD